MSKRLIALAERWRRQGRNLQQGQPDLGPLRMAGRERERCATQLSAALKKDDAMSKRKPKKPRRY